MTILGLKKDVVISLTVLKYQEISGEKLWSMVKE